MLNTGRITTITAKEVRAGDKIYDVRYYMTGKRVTVQGIEIFEGDVVFDVGHCQMVSGIAVMKRIIS